MASDLQPPFGRDDTREARTSGSEALGEDLVPVLDALPLSGRPERVLAVPDPIPATRDGRPGEAESAELRVEVRRLQEALLKIDARREGQKLQIAPRALSLYETIRQRKGGQAVARVRGSTCSACRVSIPDAVRRRILSSNDIAQCPNCDRILLVS